jgi:hypothetical protein
MLKNEEYGYRDKKNQVVEQINYLCQELGAENNVCSQIEVEECCEYRPLNYRVYRLRQISNQINLFFQE